MDYPFLYMLEGIVVGCDERQEWLLPWWWKHYAAHNNYPVLFVDFGMSPKAADWCRERGLYAPLKNFDRFQAKKISDKKKELWESKISSLFTFREAFFKKPFALLQSPFPLSIWLDLDCQIKGSLESLFYPLHLGVEIGVRKNRAPEENRYNAGVIAFRQDAKWLPDWTREVIENNDIHLIDEDALFYSLSTTSPILMELPETYNWNPLYGDNPEAIIVHFQGGFLKEQLSCQLENA